MEHVKDIELIELVAGNLSSVRAEQVQSHLLQCAECMDRSREFGQTWQAMGDWQVESAEKDITPDINTGTVIDADSRFCRDVTRIGFSTETISE